MTTEVIYTSDILIGSFTYSSKYMDMSILQTCNEVRLYKLLMQLQGQSWKSPVIPLYLFVIGLLMI